jgi:GNAT superfamily N-acetyltransferase
MATTSRGPTGADVSSARRRVEEVLDWTVSSLADEFCEVEGGSVALTPSLPLVYSLNRFRPHPTVLAEDVVALADRHLAHLPYRHIDIDDDATAATMERTLVTPGSGWKVDREVFMVLGEPVEPGGPSGSRPGTSPGDVVVELGAEEADEMMRQWHVEENLDTVPGVLDQLAVYNRREGALWSERPLGVREGDRPVAITKSRSHGAVGWVEDVYTAPDARRKGYARLLVSRAIDLARSGGHDVTFIIADDNDWPKHLYEALGFRPAWRVWTFHRDVLG